MSGRDDAHDLILVGGGLASSLIAWRLAIDRPELRVAVVEREGRLGGKHTWSFFDGDISADDRAWLEPATPHRWTAGYEIYFPGLSRALKTPYNSMTSDRLHAAVAPLLGDRLITGEAVAVSPDGVTLADQTVLKAAGVIDARGPAPTPHLDLGWQLFLGRTVRLTAPHGLTRPTIMDATVAQGDAYRFVYLLPFDERTVLVEDTYYVDGAKLDHETLRRRIDAYIHSRGWTVETVVDEEEGVLPIAQHAVERAKHPALVAPHKLAIGLGLAALGALDQLLLCDARPWLHSALKSLTRNVLQIHTAQRTKSCSRFGQQQQKGAKKGPMAL